MVTRRAIIKIGFAGGFLNGVPNLNSKQPVIKPFSYDSDDLETVYSDNIYTRLLGVRPHLPAHEHITRLGGNRLRPEVLKSMRQANDFLVDMHQLNLAAGKRVAELIGAEDAIITCGAFSSMLLASAACLTGTDMAKIESLPQVNWERSECLIPYGHSFEYERAYRCAGASLVKPTSRTDLATCLTKKTAFLAGLALVEKQNVFAPPLPLNKTTPVTNEVYLPIELIEFANQREIPVIIDMASDIPPKNNLTRFLDAGADLIAVSGGKAIGGPQSTGILAGKKELIQAARLNAYPNDQIGRGMKVSKEEIIGLIIALEHFLASDYDAEIDQWNGRAKWLFEQLKQVPGLRPSYSPNTMGYADVELSWDPELIPLSEKQVKQYLRDTEPRVEYLITLRTRLLTQPETEYLAKTLSRFFNAHRRKC